VQFFQGRQREIIRAKEQDLLRQGRGGIQSLSGLENTQHICSCSKKSPVAQTTAAMLNLSFGSFVSLVGLLSNVQCLLFLGIVMFEVGASLKLTPFGPQN